MTTEIQLNRIIVALLFALLFISVGWAAPVMYASYAPQEQFIEVHEFDPQNTTVGADHHTVCWQRDAHHPTTAEMSIEMILIDEDGGHEVYTRNFKTYFEENPSITSFRQPLPPDLEAGKYRYEAVAELSLADGRVTRIVAWTSEPFYVSEVQASTHSPSC